MYNIEKLESEWKRYQYKRIIIPSIFGIFSFVVLAILVWIYPFSFTVDNNTTSETRNMVYKDKQIDENIKEKEKEKEKEKVESHIAKLETTVPSLIKKDDNTKKKIGQIIFQNEANTMADKSQRKNLLIQVTERTDSDLVRDIENRFEFSKDKADSLFLAKYYYDKKDYPSAEKWAFETNKLDNMIEESWIVFAKALAKQGKRIDALKVLRAFSDQTSSQKAKDLIDKIRRGKNF